MSTNVQPRHAGQAIVGALSIYVAPGGTPMPVIDVPVQNGGTQTLIYGTAANTAGINAALAAAATETGFGKGAMLRLSFSQPTANAAWVAWVATSEDLDGLPATDGATWVKSGSTITRDTVDYTVYTLSRLATNTDAQAVVTFGGDQIWTAVGYQEACDIDESGITVSHDQTLTEIRCAGAPGPTKVVRDTDDFKVSFDLKDLTAETYALVMDRAAITHSPNAGGVGWRSFQIHREVEMAEYAIVARGYGLSSYVQGGNIQYWAPYMVQSGSPQPVFNKQGAAALAVEFMAIEDRTAAAALRYGRFVQQDRIR